MPSRRQLSGYAGSQFEAAAGGGGAVVVRGAGAAFCGGAGFWAGGAGCVVCGATAACWTGAGRAGLVVTGATGAGAVDPEVVVGALLPSVAARPDNDSAAVGSGAAELGVLIRPTWAWPVEALSLVPLGEQPARPSATSVTGTAAIRTVI